MARIRTIKPEFWSDEKLAPLDPITRLVFLGLISMADDAGRLLDNVKQIDAFIFPETDHSARDALATLHQLGRIIRYQLPNGQRVIQITHWERHQRVEKPGKNVLPPPPADVYGDTNETSTTVSGGSPEDLGRVSGDSPRAEVGGGGGGGTVESGPRNTPTPPPPPAHARAHAREASAPAPAGNGGRQAAAPVSAPEWAGAAAQQDPERARLIGEMLAAVEERAREIEDERRRRRFVARSRLIVSGDDLTAWQDGTGRAAPWADRPRLLRLALARTAGEEDPDLRAALRYTVAQQLDPFRPPKANAPPPGSEAARVRDELPRSGGTRTGDLERVGPAPYRPPDDDREERRWDARIERWEAEHPDEAKELLQRVAREIKDSPLGQGMAGEAMFRTLVRSKYRLEIRKLLEQAQTREMAGAA